MKVERVEAFVVGHDLEEPFAFSQWSYDRRETCLVRVTCEGGSFGWGEGYGPARVVAEGVRFLAPLVTGSDPLREGQTWSRMRSRSLDYARSGVLAASLSAVDVALWDLKGKLLGVPVSVLLGGARRDRVKVYATGMYFTEGPNLAARLAAEAAGYAELGFEAVKMKVGLGVTADLKNARAVRAAIGGDVALMVDANHAYSRSEARRLAAALEELDVAWFEEPLSPDDYEGYAELRARTAIPLAAGECEYFCDGFRRLFEGGCVDIAQPDICAAGGLSEVRHITALARTHGVNLAPHCWGTGIAFAAALHFCAALDAVPGRLDVPEPLLEMDRTENPLRDRLTRPVFEVRGGRVEVPAEPGLGIEVNPEMLEEFSSAGVSHG
jgi:D-galactarolactone cycloisomerase